jgi:phosphoglucomutase
MDLEPDPPHFTVSSLAERIDLASRMVLSASGWRLCFAQEPDSRDASITPAQRDLVAVAATVFIDFLATTAHLSSGITAIGSDTRPTGPVLADTVLRVFLARGIPVRWLGAVASPEIMAYTKTSCEVQSFFYLSASHNPPGYNGFKFGLSDGAVLPAEQAAPLAESFLAALGNQEKTTDLIDRMSNVPPELLASAEHETRRWKSAAAEAYKAFTLEVGSGIAHHEERNRSFLAPLRIALNRRPLGVIGELNGSARSTSIDRFLLPALGLRAVFFNDRPGELHHQILPEGAGLDYAATLLARYHRDDPTFQCAYVPDNDGDRGNLVFIDRERRPLVLQAQQVFALAVMAQLAWHRHRGHETEGMCVVVNGATSARVDELARRFGVDVHRAEVGEANVVSLAEKLRRSGRTVPILGEGSNGGIIIPPSTVRDPMSTVISLSLFHAFELGREIPGAAEDGTDLLSADLLAEAVAGLPPYTTIETDDPLAKMQVGEIPHCEIKSAYETLLADRIPEAISILAESFPVKRWRLWNYEGTRTTEGPGNRSGMETGGLRLVFEDEREHAQASVWMRGSGTEPVFRVLAECRGTNRPLVEKLIRWQRDIIAEATRLAGARPT